MTYLPSIRLLVLLLLGLLFLALFLLKNEQTGYFIKPKPREGLYFVGRLKIERGKVTPFNSEA